MELTGITQAMSAPVASAGGADLPQYSWGFDPATQSWGYFMSKAGSQSDAVGRKAGDKLLSYKAPKGDAASMAQEALNHQLNTQVTANAPVAAPAAQVTPAPVAGSGIANALGRETGSGNGRELTGGLAGNGTNYTDSEWDVIKQMRDEQGWNNPYDSAGLQSVIGLARSPLKTVYDALTGKPNEQNEALKSYISSSYGGDSGESDSSPGSAQNRTDARGGYGSYGGGDTSTDSNGASVGAGPASPMGGDPASRGMGSYSSGSDSSGSDSSGSDSSGSDSSGDSTSSGSAPGGGAATGGLAQAGRIRHFAAGGPPAGLHAAASLPPRFTRGPGDGQSDEIPVTMSDGGQGRLADNEFVIPADAVSALGSGSSEAGARALYAMVDRIRQTAHGSKQQAKPVDPLKVMPA